MKKITALFLTVILMMTVLITPVFAVEADEQRTTIGADLTQEQVAKIYEDFGIEKGSVKEITVTNADERAYLEGLVDERKIGYVALSCTYIKTLKEGEGTDITIKNINSLLEYNLSCIHALIHIMNSCTCHLYAFCQSCLMDMKTIEANSAERWYK